MSLTIHITAGPSGEWSVESPESGSLGTFPTEGQAVARAWDVAKTQTTTDVVVRSPSGAVQSHIVIRHADLIETQRHDSGEEDTDEEDERLRREILKNLPSLDDLLARLARLPMPDIAFSQEDDELPC